MDGGYPAQADIEVYLASRGLEIPTDSNPNYLQEFLQMVWAMVQRADWAGALAVYCPSSSTFNVAGGSYLYKGTVKTYTPGTAVDPTDNDTTYVWLTAAREIPVNWAMFRVVNTGRSRICRAFNTVMSGFPVKDFFKQADDHQPDFVPYGAARVLPLVC